MNSKSLLHIIPSGPGGINSFLKDWISYGTLSYKVIIFGVEVSDLSFIQFLKTNNIPFEIITKNIGVDFLAWKKLRQSVTKNSPDLIVVHTPSASPSLGTLNIPKMLVYHHAPNLLSSRDRILRWYSGNICPFSVKFESDVPSTEHTYFFKKTVNQKVFYPSQGTSNSNTRTLKIGMHGRFVPGKLFQEVLKIGLGLKQSGCFDSILVSFAGSGPMEQELKAIADSHKKEIQIEFLGQIAQEEIAFWLRSLDCYCFLSEGERSSHSLLEAMATSLPILAYQAPGITELLQSEPKAFLAEAGDYQSLVNALIQYRTNPNSNPYTYFNTSNNSYNALEQFILKKILHS